MIFTETAVSGAFVVAPEPAEDSRGFFARTFCAETFATRGLCSSFQQISISANTRRATLRGLHLQKIPHGEIKLVRCTAGAVFDVIVDVRANSPTFRHWFGIELSTENHLQLYIPEGVAHGFQTLRDNSEMTYHISSPYVPASQAGMRWNDPTIAIDWPLPEEAIISDRDRNLPDFATLMETL